MIERKTVTKIQSAPDVEIYIRCKTSEVLIDWLKERFEAIKNHEIKGIPSQAQAFLVCESGNWLPVIIFENAIKGYTSICFDTNKSPWKSDRDMALEVFKTVGFVTRFTDGLWHDGDDPDAWIQLDSYGEKQINWKT